MYIKILLAACALSQVSGDSQLPVLFQFSQPSHNVAVFRGADLQKARAAGLVSAGATGLSTGGYRAPPPAPRAYRPAPVYKPAPAPAPKVVYKPAPAPKVVYKPAPAPKVVYKPAPAPKVVYKPAPAPYKPAPAYAQPIYNEADAVYTWEYAVKDDYTYNDFGHKETREGAYTAGEYFVALPDGRLQTVTYTVQGDSGYVPVVQYTGEAQYPQTTPYAS